MPKSRLFNVRIYLRHFFIFLIFIAVFVVSAIGSFSYLTFSKVKVRSDFKFNRAITPVPSVKSEIVTDNNILFLGYGGAGHDGGNLSDVLMVLHFDPIGKKAALISVPRDLWVDIPIRSDISENHKINAAYAIGGDDKKYGLKEPQYRGEAGGGNMAKKVVSEIVGMNIDYFVAVDFDGFKNVVDKLGGLEVEVPVTFDDNFYPVKGLENETCGFGSAKIVELHQKYSGFELEKQFECRYEKIHFDKGKTHMDGTMALKYVRSRHSDQHGGDFARSQRQNALLLALKEKLFSFTATKKADEIFNQFASSLRTDLDLNAILSLAENVGDQNEYKIKYISLNDENVLTSTKSLDGQFILIPKEGEGVWSNVHKFITAEINK